MINGVTSALAINDILTYFGNPPLANAGMATSVDIRFYSLFTFQVLSVIAVNRLVLSSVALLLFVANFKTVNEIVNELMEINGNRT